MAKFNPMYGEIRGSIAGNTWSRNSSGFYIREKVTPVNPATPQQTAIRDRMANISKAWPNVLTEAQRGGWNNLAAANTYPDVFGNASTISGIMMYQKVNLKRFNAGDARLDDAPINLDVTTLTTVEITAAVALGNVIEITYPDTLTATEQLYISGVVNLSPGKNFVQNLLKFFETSAGAAASPFDSTIPVRLGNLQAGGKIFLRVQVYNSVNGATSPGQMVQGFAA